MEQVVFCIAEESCLTVTTARCYYGNLLSVVTLKISFIHSLLPPANFKIPLNILKGDLHWTDHPKSSMFNLNFLSYEN
jgi:hypothetical protein